MLRQNWCKYAKNALADPDQYFGEAGKLSVKFWKMSSYFYSSCTSIYPWGGGGGEGGISKIDDFFALKITSKESVRNVIYHPFFPNFSPTKENE